jgi:hypothetical protein
MRRKMGLKLAMAGGLVPTAFALMPSGAAAQTVNGLNAQQLLTGANPSTQNITNTYNGVSGTAGVTDSAASGTAASRVDFLASSNGGASALNIPAADSWSISADVTLHGTSLSPRKEAGIIVNSVPIGNDGEFILDTDQGEIVAFGGNAPFALFGNNGHAVNNTNGTGNPFVNGDTVFMSETYNASTGSLVYQAQDITQGGPLMTSGPNTAYTPQSDPIQIGFENQWQPNGTADSDAATFSNISITVSPPVPEPASLSLLAAGAVALCVRRRSKKLA